MRRTRLSDLLARANLTVSGLVLVGVCALGWIGARWIGSRTAYLMVYASVAVLVVAWFVGRRRLDVDVVRSDLPARMREGQSVDVTLQILGRKRASTIVVEEHVDASLSRPVRLGLASLSKGQEAEHSYALAPTRRGV